MRRFALKKALLFFFLSVMTVGIASAQPSADPVCRCTYYARWTDAENRLVEDTLILEMGRGIDLWYKKGNLPDRSPFAIIDSLVAEGIVPAPDDFVPSFDDCLVLNYPIGYDTVIRTDDGLSVAMIPRRFEKWEVVVETRRIQGFLTMAHCRTLAGYSWKAWATLELGFCFSGPWWLNNAPGLIVEAEDAEGRVFFQLVSLETTEKN